MMREFDKTAQRREHIVRKGVPRNCVTGESGIILIETYDDARQTARERTWHIVDFR